MFPRFVGSVIYHQDRSGVPPSPREDFSFQASFNIWPVYCSFEQFKATWKKLVVAQSAYLVSEMSHMSPSVNKHTFDVSSITGIEPEAVRAFGGSAILWSRVVAPDLLLKVQPEGSLQL